MATALALPGTHFKLSGALWRVLSLLVVSVFINYIDRDSLSIAAPLLKDELLNTVSVKHNVVKQLDWLFCTRTTNGSASTLVLITGDRQGRAVERQVRIPRDGDESNFGRSHSELPGNLKLGENMRSRG